MLVVRNIVAIASSLVTALSLLAFVFGPSLIIVPAAIISLISAIGASLFVTGREVSQLDRVMLGAPNVLALTGVLGLLLFVESGLVRFVIVIFISVLQSAYLTHLFFFLHVPSRYVPQTLQTVVSFLQLLAIFSLSTATFGLILMTRISLLILLPIYALFGGIMLYHTLWVAKLPEDRARKLTFLGTMMLLQIVGACIFLPTSLYVNGAIVTLTAYALFFVFQVSPADPHLLKTSKRATLLATGLFAILLLSAPWK
ncbi:MAG: hypothetical protein WCJ29_03235 [bacterium]